MTRPTHPDDEVPPPSASPSQEAVDAANPTAQQLLEHFELDPRVRAALSEALERAEQSEERLLRNEAESQNHRKRLEREQQRMIRMANEDLVSCLLPALDNLRLCVEQAPTAAREVLLAGLRATMAEFDTALMSAGVELLSAEPGEPFDAAIHEAVVQDGDSPLPPNTVTRMLQTGARYHDRVIRPVRVAVASGRS